MASGLRIAVCSQESLGLGHMRRNILIGQRLLEEITDGSVLLLANSPVAPFFQLPDGMDHVKLPSIRKINAGHWQPARLRISAVDLQRMRRNLLRDVLISYQPDSVLVDHMPAGAQGELVPALEALKQAHPDCSVILGLRDILDAPEVTARVWQSEGAYNALRRYYDQILIYGSPEIFETSKVYHLPVPREGIHYCGYVVNRGPVQPASKVRQFFQVQEKQLVFVSAGGGSDAHFLMRTYLQALRVLGSRANFASLVAIGVNAPPDLCQELRIKAQGLPVQVVPYVADSMSAMAAADLVVSMAGYNTLSEVLKLRKKALVVPRIGPSTEQKMRARLFADRGLIDMMDPEGLSAEKLAARLLADLERDDYPVRGEAIDMSGSGQAASRILDLIGKEACGAKPSSELNCRIHC